jgi:hypothetical protein
MTRLVAPLIAAACVWLASCQSLPPLNPAGPPGTTTVIILDDRGHETARHQYRPGTISFDVPRHRLTFIDAATGQRITIADSWRIE